MDVFYFSFFSFQGNTGIVMGMFLVSFVILVALVTVLSGIGVCEKCSIGNGGVYSMISTVLGGQVGGTIGLLYIFGQVTGKKKKKLLKENLETAVKILILCFPATSAIPVMLQQERALQGPFSPTLIPTSKPVQGNMLPGMGHNGGGTGCLNTQDMPSHPKLPPVPGHVLAGERFDLKQRGRGQGGHLKPSGRLWAGRLVLACSRCPQGPGKPWLLLCRTCRRGAGVGAELGSGEGHS